MTAKIDRLVVVTISSPNARDVIWRSRSMLRGRRIQGLRIRGQSERSDNPTDDKASISIYGLGDADVAALRGDGVEVRVEAGYGDNPVEVIAGAIMPGTISDEKQRPERITSFSISDGGTITRSTPIAISYANGVEAEAAIRDVAKAAGLAVGVIRLGQSRTYPGLMLYGSAAELLDQFADDTGSTLAIQSGRLQMWPKGAARSKLSITVKPSTGRLAQPTEAGAGLLDVETLLAPQARAGDVAKMRESTHDGDWVIKLARSTFDSGYDRPFFTKITIGPLP